MAKNTTHPPAPERFTMGDNRMFHSREGNVNREGLPTWEVYSIGLEQWATCRSAETARAVSDALEAFYSNPENWLKRLETCKVDEVLSVCREICEDDCGDTDALTMELARKLLLQLHDKKWVGYTPPENK